MMVLTCHCVTQSAESMSSESIIAKNFSMVDGGITAYGLDGRIVGVSQYADLESTCLRNGENPLVDYYKNVKFLF